MPILLHLVHTFRKTSPLRDRVAAWFHQHTITSDQFDGPNLYTDVVFFETRRAQWYYAYHTLLRHKHHAGKFVFREGAQVDQQGCVQISNISKRIQPFCNTMQSIDKISGYALTSTFRPYIQCIKPYHDVTAVRFLMARKCCPTNHLIMLRHHHRVWDT